MGYCRLRRAASGWQRWHWPMPRQVSEPPAEMNTLVREVAERIGRSQSSEGYPLPLRMSGGSPIGHDGWTGGSYQGGSDGAWTWQQGRGKKHREGRGEVRRKPGPALLAYLSRATEVKTALDEAFGIHLNLCSSDGESRLRAPMGLDHRHLLPSLRPFSSCHFTLGHVERAA